MKRVPKLSRFRFRGIGGTASRTATKTLPLCRHSHDGDTYSDGWSLPLTPACQQCTTVTHQMGEHPWYLPQCHQRRTFTDWRPARLTCTHLFPGSQRRPISLCALLLKCVVSVSAYTLLTWPSNDRSPAPATMQPLTISRTENVICASGQLFSITAYVQSAVEIGQSSI